MSRQLSSLPYTEQPARKIGLTCEKGRAEDVLHSQKQLLVCVSKLVTIFNLYDIKAPVFLFSTVGMSFTFKWL